MTEAEHEIECLAVAVHGALAAGHLLGLIFNLRRKQWFDATIHLAGSTYDSIAVYKHYKHIKENK